MALYALLDERTWILAPERSEREAMRACIVRLRDGHLYARWIPDVDAGVWERWEMTDYDQDGIVAAEPMTPAEQEVMAR